MKQIALASVAALVLLVGCGSDGPVASNGSPNAASKDRADIQETVGDCLDNRGYGGCLVGDCLGNRDCIKDQLRIAKICDPANLPRECGMTGLRSLPQR